MSDADEYAVSQILQSIKRDRSLSVVTEEHVISDEHQIKELKLDEVVKIASNIGRKPRKSLEGRFKLPRKAHSGIHTADQPKAKWRKVSGKTKKEDSVKTKKEDSVKTKKETCSSSNLKKFKSLRLRNPPKPFYTTIKCLSIAQKKKVKDMGFGSLLEFSCDGVPSKLGHFVADKFDPKSMKLKLENGDIQITPELIQHILGIPCGGTPISSLPVKDTKKECYVNWRAQFVKELRPSDMVRKIEESEDDGIVFVLNFIILFLNTMVECVPSGKCKIDVLERFDEDVDIKSVDWSGYVYDCLKKCKHGWKRDDTGSFFTGPLTVLVLIYLDLTSFKHLETLFNVRAISFWSVEMMKKREILEMESGGFGCCEIKNLSEKRVQEESDLEEFIKDIDSNLASFLDAKMQSQLLFTRGFQKFPNSQLLIEKKRLFDSIFIKSDSKDDTSAAGPSSKKR